MTNRELWDNLVRNEWNKDFDLELLPSANDGESNHMEVKSDLTQT